MEELQLEKLQDLDSYRSSLEQDKKEWLRSEKQGQQSRNMSLQQDVHKTVRQMEARLGGQLAEAEQSASARVEEAVSELKAVKKASQVTPLPAILSLHFMPFWRVKIHCPSWGFHFIVYTTSSCRPLPLILFPLRRPRYCH